MKKNLSLVLLLVLGACAKERTTVTRYSNEGIDADQVETSEKNRQKVKRNQDPTVKPDRRRNLVDLDEGFSPEDLAELYHSYDGKVISVGPPSGVFEFIAQKRLQKTLGRLTCTEQTPMPDGLKSSATPHYYCSVDRSRNKVLVLADKTLYESLDLPEVEIESDTKNHQPDAHLRTFRKSLARFHCDKIIRIPSGDVRYECVVDSSTKTSSPE